VSIITRSHTARALLCRDVDGIGGWRQTGAGVRRVQKVTRGGAGVVVDGLTGDVVVASRQAVDESASTADGRNTAKRQRIYTVVSPDLHRLIFHSTCRNVAMYRPTCTAHYIYRLT